MIVQPELPDHPDFVMLKRAVGDFALEALIRLWGHCQSNNRGECWTGKGPDYVEAVARWNGVRGELYKALTQYGWVDEFEGGVNLHNWGKQNAKLVSARSNGRRGGRPHKYEPENPPITEPKPNSNTNETGFSDNKNGGSTDTSKKPTDNPPITEPKPTDNPNGIGLTHASNPILSNPSTPIQFKTCFEYVPKILTLLNELTGAEFNPPLMDREEIASRLMETQGDFAGVEKMVRRQCALWKNDSKTRIWLKPGTLFGPKFYEYYGQRNLQITGPGPNKSDKSAHHDDRSELLQTLAAARQAFENDPDNTSLKTRIEELELATA